MLKDQGGHDVGNAEDKCGKGKAGQATCHRNEGAMETSIDYFFANSMLMPAISLCDVDHTSSFPTHRPLRIEVNTEKLDVVANQLQTPTNYAERFEEKVKLEYLKREQAVAANAASEGSSTDKKDAITENDVRKELKHELHKLMDEQIEQRQHRLKHAKFMKDTTRIWQLIAAAVEKANIAFHGLQEKEAKKMEGRSRVLRRRIRTSSEALKNIM